MMIEPYITYRQFISRNMLIWVTYITYPPTMSTKRRLDEVWRDKEEHLELQRADHEETLWQ